MFMSVLDRDGGLCEEQKMSQSMFLPVCSGGNGYVGDWMSKNDWVGVVGW